MKMFNYMMQMIGFIITVFTVLPIILGICYYFYAVLCELKIIREKLEIIAYREGVDDECAKEKTN